MLQDDLPSGAAPSPDRSGHILVVESEKALVRELVSSLRAAGYLVDVAECGRQALVLAAQTRYSGLILGLSLPDIAGILVYLMLRGIDPELSRRTVFVSGSQRGAAPRHELDGLGLGCLSRPFAIDDLIRRLEAR